MVSAIPPSPSPPAVKRSRRRLWFVCGGLGLLLALTGWGTYVLVFGGRAASEESAGEAQAVDPQTAADARDRELARAVLGQWHDTYMGTKRTITFGDDGRGEMVVKIVGSFTLRFEMVWSVADGVLKLRTVRGEPKWLTDPILAREGDRAEHPILEAAAERLLLLDRDGKTQLDWRRTP